MSTLSSPPAQPFRSFELIDTVGEAYQCVFNNIKLLPAVICLPLLLDAMMILATEFTPLGTLVLDQEAGAQWPPSGEQVVKILVSLGMASIQVFSLVLLYSAWYRLILLGPDRAYPRFFYPINPRHIRLFGYGWLVGGVVVLLTLCVILLAFPILGLGTGLAISHLLLIPVAFYIFFVIPLRFSYLFPAVAVDERYRLMDSWRHTRKQTLKLIGGSILCLLPATTVAGLLGADVSIGVSLTVGSDSATPPLLSPFFTEVLAYLVGTFNSLVIAAFIALAFKASTGWIPEEPAPGTGLPETL